jgi:hypothetical protein
MLSRATLVVLGPAVLPAAGPYRDQEEAREHLRELAGEIDGEGLPTITASAIREAALDLFLAEVDLAELMLASGSAR